VWQAKPESGRVVYVVEWLDRLRPLVWDDARQDWVPKRMALTYWSCEGARFETRKEAESVVVLLAAKNPDYLGTLSVQSYRL